MAEVRLAIAGREYIVTCRDGEEPRLNDLGRMVDAKVREAGGSAGGLNESRQLLFAALLLADQIYDNGVNPAGAPQSASGIDPAIAQRMAESIEKLAERIETFAAGLEQSTMTA